MIPESSPLDSILGIALASLGRLDDAIADFRQAIAIDPRFDDARRNLAMAIRTR